VGFLSGDANGSRATAPTSPAKVNSIVAQPAIATNSLPGVNPLGTPGLADLLFVSWRLTQTLAEP